MKFIIIELNEYFDLYMQSNRFRGGGCHDMSVILHQSLIEYWCQMETSEAIYEMQQSQMNGHSIQRSQYLGSKTYHQKPTPMKAIGELY